MQKYPLEDLFRLRLRAYRLTLVYALIGSAYIVTDIADGQTAQPPALLLTAMCLVGVIAATFQLVAAFRCRRVKQPFVTAIVIAGLILGLTLAQSVTWLLS